ncbi:MAG: hypothetical protein K2K20_12865 [Lachnospiraceae bacterium]|nr:hypothetical protein [Lachnospiraceae bacterium]
MSVSGVYGMGVNTYAYTNNSKKTTETGNFADEVQKAEESRSMQTKSNSSAWAGDMVIPQPPNYSGFTYDSSISNKSKEEMTMDEYKQWIMNQMSGMPVSSWVRSSFSSGALVIKEEAFERMKSDPEYEEYVLNRIRSYYSASSGWSIGSNNVSYEVIGASPEECYGYAGPAGGSGSNIAGNEKSWWEKRHEKMEELLEEQEKVALKKAQARKALAQENYLKSQFESQQRLHSFLMESAQNGQNTSDMSAFQSVSAGALAATAYEDIISTFSKSVIGSQKI